MAESTTQQKLPVTEQPKVENPPSTSNQTGDAIDSSPVFVTPNVDFEKAPAKYINTRFQSIILWEKPVKSAIALVLSLGILILTQFYSLLQILAALSTVIIGVNWVYVNVHVQAQRFVGSKAPNEVINPHTARMQTSPKALVSRDKIIRFCNLLVDIVEAFTVEATKVVLIEDNFRSLKFFGASFTVWTVAKYLSTKWIVGAGLLLIFSVPRIYLQHQEKIDAQLAKSSEQARVLANQYSEIAKQRASGVYGQAVKATKRGGQSQKKVQ
ncbi:Reticulon-domain-containing protein [Umbelopsis sp. AD052]|nr:Reticulon-domain-containing protein [Umbelopsis sp. AD052]